MKISPCVVSVFLALIALHAKAQDDIYANTRPDQPSRLRSLAGYAVVVGFEQKNTVVANTAFGQYVVNRKNAISLYLPVEYQSRYRESNLTGVSLGYTYVIRNSAISRFSGLLVSMQTSIPAVSKTDNIGNGRWAFQPSITAAFRLSSRVGFAPSVGYLYYTSSVNKKKVNYSSNGIALQPTLVYRVNNKLYFSSAIAMRRLNSPGIANTRYYAQVAANYTIGRYRVSAGWSPSFNTTRTAVNAGFRMFF